MVKKHIRLLNRSILRSEIGVRPKLDAKNWAARNAASELTNPLEMVKKTCQAMDSLNSDV